MGRELNDAAQVIGIMLLTILFGLLLDQFLFGLIERKIRHRWGLTAEQDLEREGARGGFVGEFYRLNSHSHQKSHRLSPNRWREAVRL